MSAFRVIQVSDTHLAQEPKFALQNWQKLVAHIRRREPDLVIHTGDVSMDGVRFPEQLQQARDCHSDLGAPFLVLPGNHDVGELPGAAGELEPEVCEAACQRFIDTSKVSTTTLEKENSDRGFGQSSTTKFVICYGSDGTIRKRLAILRKSKSARMAPKMRLTASGSRSTFGTAGKPSDQKSTMDGTRPSNATSSEARRSGGTVQSR